MLPHFFPAPDAVGGGVEEAVAELMGEHHDLSAVVGFVGKHVGKHGGSGGPFGDPASAREFFYATVGIFRQGFGEHRQTLGGTFFVGGGGLLDGAFIRVEPGRAFQVGSGILQPDQAAVVEVGEYGGDGASGPRFAGRRGPPGLGIEMFEHELVHGVIGSVGFQQHSAEIGGGLVAAAHGR